MSVRVMTAVFDHSQSRLADRLVMLVIADRSDDDGTGCYRGKESIARMARVSRTTVTEAIGRLEGLGELAIDRRPGRSSQYRVVLPGVGQNPADLESEGAEVRPTVGHPSGRGSATRPAAIHPDTSMDSSDPIHSWRPAEIVDPDTNRDAIAQARAALAAGRAKSALPT